MTTIKMRLFLALTTAALAACAGALLAGNVSTALANILVQKGGPSFLREPINALIALALFVSWQKWRPASLYSPPKWGNVGIGLVLGLALGIALPGMALALMSIAGVATIKAPQAAPVMLAVPFIFLIIHGLAEEMLVRGIAQREGNNFYGALGGVGLAALTFMVLQTLQGFGGVLEILNSLLFGAVLGFLALGAGGIWTAIGAHAGWSWLEVAVLGERGQIEKTASWFAGSGQDSYGSPAFTLVLLIVLCVQLPLHLRAQKSKA
jgi:membrane protease YdiL (CAAX protease family)